MCVLRFYHINRCYVLNRLECLVKYISVVIHHDEIALPWEDAWVESGPLVFHVLRVRLIYGEQTAWRGKNRLTTTTD